MSNIIDGKAFAKNMRFELSQRVEYLKSEHGLTPGLAVVLVGDDPASEIYVRNKGRQTLEVGMNSYEHKLSDKTSEMELLGLIDQLNEDSKVHGILVQLPLPKHIDEEAVINAITPEKDVDGFSYINVGKLVTGTDSIVSCTPLGCLMLLKDSLGDLSGKKAIIIGRSNIVGKPMASLLIGESCTVTVAHSRTVNLAEECRQADIVVAAVGQPEMVKGDWIKPGATVIDVGINRILSDKGKNKLVGDVEFSSASKVAAAITPVPGGVGPMTIACLLHNTVEQACKLNDVGGSS